MLLIIIFSLQLKPGPTPDWGPADHKRPLSEMDYRGIPTYLNNHQTNGSAPAQVRNS